MRKFLRCILYFVVFAVVFLVFNTAFGTIGKGSYINVEMTAEEDAQIEIFYADDNSDFSQENSLMYDFKAGKDGFKLSLPTEAKKLRIDFGDSENKRFNVKSIEYGYNGGKMLIYPDNYELLQFVQLDVQNNDSDLELASTGDDPSIAINNIVLENENIVNKKSVVAAVVISLVIVLIMYRFVSFGGILRSVKDLLAERKLIFSLASNDFKTRFAGSYFGIIWAFVQPICTILVFWFVFQVGFRNPNVGDVEYILWFMTGLIPWFFFSEAWNSATNAFMEYSYLVKKVVFKINILPVIKIISALYIHLFFVVFMLVVYIFYGRFPTVYTLQIIYYMLCMVALVTALAFVTAPLIIFFKDLGQIMNIILQFGMWLTPIMWSVDNLPQGMGVFVNIFKLNPMYYIVQGYRNSMIYNIGFYDNILQTVYFWSLILVLSVLGTVIYKRLKPHFADVL